MSRNIRYSKIYEYKKSGGVTRIDFVKTPYDNLTGLKLLSIHTIPRDAIMCGLKPINR